MHKSCFHQSLLDFEKPIYLKGIEPLFELTKAPGEPGSLLNPDYYLCPGCMKQLQELVQTRKDEVEKGVIAYLEQTGRLEELAQFYEWIDNPAKAGDIRNRMRSQTVKHVTIDLNRLIENIRTQGLSVPYKCPNCGATLTMDGKSRVDGLKFCSYCGTALNLELIAKVIEDALR